ncbi:MAG TPA: hypothetical protein VGP57_24995 [Actinoplanes sp.]|jgi:hypothetical protein|nr:hypothetical protein [Actinoplanes sp.]
MTSGRGTELSPDADLCSAVLGEQLTAYLAGADSVPEFRSWLTGADDEVRRQIAPRLAAARQVILAFRAENKVTMALPWLREVGAAGDDAPARLIRGKGDDEGTANTVVQAARAWVRWRRPQPAALA